MKYLHDMKHQTIGNKLKDFVNSIMFTKSFNKTKQRGKSLASKTIRKGFCQ